MQQNPIRGANAWLEEQRRTIERNQARLRSNPNHGFEQTRRTFVGGAADAVDGATWLVNTPINALLRLGGGRDAFQYPVSDYGSRVPQPEDFADRATRAFIGLGGGGPASAAPRGAAAAAAIRPAASGAQRAAPVVDQGRRALLGSAIAAPAAAAAGRVSGRGGRTAAAARVPMGSVAEINAAMDAIERARAAGAPNVALERQFARYYDEMGFQNQNLPIGHPMHEVQDGMAHLFGKYEMWDMF